MMLSPCEKLCAICCCSLAQLSGRVRNSSLRGFPAVLHGYTRIFGGLAVGWGGAVASLAQKPSSATLGSVVPLSQAEFDLLTQFEGGYNLIDIDVQVQLDDGTWAERGAVAYIANETFRRWTGSPPSEAYLVAIHAMLREQRWSGEKLRVDVHRLDEDSETIVHEYTWEHPGVHGLSLPALLVEANCHPLKAERRWTLPRDIARIVQVLTKLGVERRSDIARIGLGAEGESDDSELRALLDQCAADDALTHSDVLLLSKLS